MCLEQTELLHLLAPIGIVVELLILGISLIIIQLRLTFRILVYIEQFFFHQHRVLIAIEQLIPFRLIRTFQSQRISEFRFSPHPTLGHDINHAIRSFGAPYCRSSRIFQHRDTLDVFGINGQQFCKPFVRHAAIINIIISICLENIIIYYNQRFRIAINSRYTT